MRRRAAAFSDGFAAQTMWALGPLMEVVAQDRTRATCWTLVQNM